MPASQPPSCSPMPALHKIEELHKQLEIAKKRQEAECTAHLQHKEEECCKCEEKERKDCEEKVWKEMEVKVWKEVEVKVWREKEEKEKWERMEKEKGKEKEIIIVMLEDEAGSQPPKRRRRVAKKVPAWLAMEPCCCCLDRGYECEKPLAGMKGTACPRCVKLHITCKRARVEGDKEEEVLEWRKCMWPEVIILIAGPLQAAAPPLEDAIWALLKKVAGHLRMIVSKVKRIGDEVHKVKEDRRVRKTLQVGVQTEVHEVMEVGVGEEEEGKGEEVEDGEARDKDGEGDEDMEE